MHDFFHQKILDQPGIKEINFGLDPSFGDIKREVGWQKKSRKKKSSQRLFFSYCFLLLHSGNRLTKNRFQEEEN
jgi:hypothetical protein